MSVAKKPELLAPAGDFDSLRAALAAGADAVYFGLDDGFNARARAANFALANLPETCALIHRAGARAYLTLNTLIFEGELEAVAGIIRGAALAGVDALIVQDPAVALLARAIAPTLEVHASTQMTISSAEGAVFAAQLGCTRVVVPRELSVAEIGQIAQATDIELEVFIHGALCMSWSGQCQTSVAWGGRSANRGQCAQSCRMPYDLVVDGQVSDLGDVQYLLSPQDLSGLSAVPELVEIGVHGLKIEGRQKGPQYVTTAVQAYRRQLDGNTTQQLSSDRTRMALSYSRGFSAGFLHGGDHQTLVEGRFPKHRGLLLGDVVAVDFRGVKVRPTHRRATGGAGMGVAVDDSDGTKPELSDASSQDLRVEPRPGMGVVFENGHPEDRGEPGGALYYVDKVDGGWLLGFGKPGPDLRKVQPGFKVWLTSDPKLAVETHKILQQPEPQGRIGVELIASGAQGQPLTVALVTTGGVGKSTQVIKTTEGLLTQASGAGISDQLLRDKVGSLGGTPFCLNSLDTTRLQPGLHVAVSQLKHLRRALVEALETAVINAHIHEVAPQRQVSQLPALQPAAQLVGDLPITPDSQLLVLCRNDAQLDAVIAAGLPEVELDWMDLVGLTRAVDKARAAGLRVVIATVRVQKPGEDGFDRRIERLRPDGVLVRHWGGLMHFSQLRDRPTVHGDFSLNVTNSVTARHLFALGCDTLTAAHDLDERQLKAMLEHIPASRLTVAVHHHIATFHTEHCVYAHLLSKGKSFRDCGRPCEKHEVSLRDHLGLQHPVIVDVGCRNTVFNAQAQSAASVVPRLQLAGVRRFRVEFVRETGDQALLVLRSWRALLDGKMSAQQLLATIGVHEQFGITAGTMRVLSGAI